MLVSYIMLTTCNKPCSGSHYSFSYIWYHRLQSFVQYSKQATANMSGTVNECAEYTHAHMPFLLLTRRFLVNIYSFTHTFNHLCIIHDMSSSFKVYFQQQVFQKFSINALHYISASQLVGPNNIKCIYSLLTVHKIW
jgi:hypothetical protein